MGSIIFQKTKYTPPADLLGYNKIAKRTDAGKKASHNLLELAKEAANKKKEAAEKIAAKNRVSE